MKISKVLQSYLPFISYCLFSIILTAVFFIFNGRYQTQKNDLSYVGQITYVERTEDSVIFKATTSYDNYIDINVEELSIDGKRYDNINSTIISTLRDNELELYVGNFNVAEQATSRSKVYITKAEAKMGISSPLAWLYWFSNLVTGCFIVMLVGGVICGVLGLLARGYLALPVFIRIILWVVLFPVMVILFGFLGGTAMGGEKVYDKDGIVQGYYDSKTETYRDKHGRIRTVDWWLN